MPEPAGSERGTTVIEMVLVMALFVVVSAMTFSALVSAMKHERATGDLAAAIGEGRSALDQLVREVREADGLWTGVGVDATAWYDADADGVQDANELVHYDIAMVGGERVLTRSSAAGTRTLATSLDASTSLIVQAAGDGVLLRAVLVVDVTPNRAPEPTTLETEVLARNA